MPEHQCASAKALSAVACPHQLRYCDHQLPAVRIRRAARSRAERDTDKQARAAATLLPTC